MKDLIKPTDVGADRGVSYIKEYKKEEVDTFMNNLNYCKENIQNFSLYLTSKNISQSKLRDCGFKIVRDKSKANVILIEDIRKEAFVNSANNYRFYCNNEVENYFTELFLENSLNYKYILIKDLYKYLYKYEGDLKLFNNISELLKSGTSDNIKIAMEFMANANWEDNQIYLQELFNLYYGSMRGTSYKSSISFQGFLSSLNFLYSALSLNHASDYRELCETQEHHDWVYNKYLDKFELELKNLTVKYKIKIDKLEYSIDKSIIEEEE